MQFQQSLRLMDVGPTIGALREKFRRSRAPRWPASANGSASLTQEQEAAIEALLMSTVNKISHPILNQMRRFYETTETDASERRDIFNLEE